MQTWLEVLKIVALLCQSHGAAGVQEGQDKYQLKCQQYYIKCLEGNSYNISTKLEQCILNRTIP